MAVSDYILGECCECIGISIASLQDMNLLPALFSNVLTKEVVYQLNKYRSNNSHSWNDLYTWLAKLCGCTCQVLSTCQVLKAALSRLNKGWADA